ncbi:MAG: hypothetical protein ACFB14_10135 [Leptolyngbyaceae cyanobacterium]
MKGLLSPSVIENFTVGVITSIITGLAVWSWAKLRTSQLLNRRSAFFGIAPKENCLIVINHDPRNQNAMAMGDVGTLIEMVRLVDTINGKATIAKFDRILEPAGTTTEFCIGGPSSNQRIHVHLANFLPGIVFNDYIADNPDSLAILTKDRTYHYKKDQDEYAILARFFPEPDAYPVILICGQTSKANHGAVHYLVKAHDGYLRKTFGNRRPFCVVVKLRSPLTYGVRSVQFVEDISKVAFVLKT